MPEASVSSSHPLPHLSDAVGGQLLLLLPHPQAPPCPIVFVVVVDPEGGRPATVVGSQPAASPFGALPGPDHRPGENHDPVRGACGAPASNVGLSSAPPGLRDRHQRVPGTTESAPSRDGHRHRRPPGASLHTMPAPTALTPHQCL